MLKHNNCLRIIMVLFIKAKHNKRQPGLQARQYTDSTLLHFRSLLGIATKAGVSKITHSSGEISSSFLCHKYNFLSILVFTRGKLILLACLMGAKIEKIIVTTKLFLLYFQKKSMGKNSSPKGETQLSLHLDGQKWSLRSLVIKVIKDSPTGSKNRDNNKNINIYIFIIVLKKYPQSQSA